MSVSDIGKKGAPARARVGGLLDDEQAELFDVLYRDHFEFVYRNLRRLGVRDASVDDAVQEVYLVVLRQIGRYQPGTHPRAWLFAIASRVASNQRRGQRRRGHAVPLQHDILHSPAKGPYERTVRAEARELLHAFLDSLDEDKRNVFVMAELEQMTAAEIGQALGVNANTVAARLRAARRALVRATSGLRVELGGRDDAGGGDG